MFFECHPICPYFLKVLKLNVLSIAVMNTSNKISVEKTDTSSHTVVVIMKQVFVL